MRDIENSRGPLRRSAPRFWIVALVVGLGGGFVFQPPRLQGQEIRPIGSADLVIVNGKLWLGTEPVGARGRAQAEIAFVGQPNNRLGESTALAVVGDRIRAVGDDATIRNWVGPNTRVIDAGGRRVIPGITDSHAHLVSGGLQLGRLNLRDVKNREDFVLAVEKAARGKRPDEWVLGGRWSVESWSDPQSPRREWLDPVTGNTPVFLERMDGHAALVNSAALQLAGITVDEPKDPPGGEIERDPKTGAPTGILKESAMDLVRRFIPPSSDEESFQGLLRALDHAGSFGITSVHNMSEPSDLFVFARAHAENKLTVRITAYLSVDEWPIHYDRVLSFPIDDHLLRVAGLKGYMDGSLGSRTAYMRRPYADTTPDAKYPRGQLTTFAAKDDTFRLMLAQTQNRGLQMAVHAIGDEANHLLLNGYEYAGKISSRKDVRNRIEHAQHLLVDDIPRFRKLGVVASMQPYHKADDGRYAEKAIGADYLKGSYAFRQLLDAGALLCFGSDFPVVTMNPFAGIDAAVSARTLDGRVWLPAHSIFVDEALRAYTVSPAEAVHRLDRLGTLEVDKFADVVILATDVLTVPVAELDKVKVWQTIMGGRVVFSAAGG